jgi:hypothetical protein
MALNQEEKERLSLTLVHQLSPTPYACTSLGILNGGTANFLFRGLLVQPLSNGQKTIVVKHSKEYVSANRDFKLDVSRCVGVLLLYCAFVLHIRDSEQNYANTECNQTYEVAMLESLNLFRWALVEHASVRTPCLYYFDRKTATQVLEDLTDAIDLRTLLESQDVLTILSTSISTSVGHALGAWLRSFHSWVSEPAQAGLKQLVGKNAPMRKIRYAISYGAIIDIVQKFPEIWEEKKEVLEEVRDMATAEYEKSPQENIGGNYGIIHGDFWTGK